MKKTVVPFVFAVAVLSCSSAWAWSEGHRVIARRVLEVLPLEDLVLFGAATNRYVEHDTLIPDLVGLKDGSEHYVWDFVGTVLTDDFGDPRFEGIHLYLGPDRAYAVLAHYFRKALEAGRSGNVSNFVAYVGCFSHALGDWSCPAHATSGDNMMTRLKTYLPPPKGMESVSLHSRIETGGFSLSDVACEPRILATTPEELAMRFLPMCEQASLAARATIVPMVKDVYRGDMVACEAKQKPSGARGLQLVADAVHSICSMVRATDVPARPEWILLTATMPFEAKSLFYSQRQFVWDPYWGEPSSGCTLKDGNVPVPMAVVLDGRRTEIAEGMGFGTQHYSWFVPKGVFGRFTAVCGLHADLSQGGRADVTILTNGRVRDSFPLDGGGEAHRVAFALDGTETNLEISVKGDLKARKTYFVFGEPRLWFCDRSESGGALGEGNDIRMFGAREGGSPRENAAAIQRAIDAAAEKCGRVVVPAGTFVSGTLWLKSGVTLHLDRGAVLKASDDLEDYNAEDAYPENFGCPKSEYWRGLHFIICRGQKGVALEGEGAIDGNGDAFFEERPRAYFPWMKSGAAAWWNGIRWAKDKEKLRPGQLVVFVKCEDVTVKGITIRNSPCWSIFFHGCRNVTVRDYTVRNGPDDGNTDGVDLDCVSNATLENLDIETGDDAIAIRGAPRRLLLPKPPPCENITIRNAKLRSTSSVFRLGVGDGLIRNVTVENVTSDRGGTAITMDTLYGDPEQGGVDMENIVFRNCRFDNCRSAYSIWTAGRRLEFGVRDVTFENCTFPKGISRRVGGDANCPFRPVRIRTGEASPDAW